MEVTKRKLLTREQQKLKVMTTKVVERDLLEMKKINTIKIDGVEEVTKKIDIKRAWSAMEKERMAKEMAESKALEDEFSQEDTDMSSLGNFTQQKVASLKNLPDNVRQKINNLLEAGRRDDLNCLIDTKIDNEKYFVERYRTTIPEDKYMYAANRAGHPPSTSSSLPLPSHCCEKHSQELSSKLQENFELLRLNIQAKLKILVMKCDHCQNGLLGRWQLDTIMRGYLKGCGYAGAIGDSAMNNLLDQCVATPEEQGRLREWASPDYRKSALITIPQGTYSGQTFVDLLANVIMDLEYYSVTNTTPLMDTFLD